MMMPTEPSEAFSFSSEMNPLKRRIAEDSDSFSLFGKKIKKKKAYDAMMALAGQGDESEQDGMSMMPMPSGVKGSMPKYRPKDLYGGMFSMYGGQRVRGGLLGE